MTKKGDVSCHTYLALCAKTGIHQNLYFTGLRRPPTGTEWRCRLRHRIVPISGNLSCALAARCVHGRGCRRGVCHYVACSFQERPRAGNRCSREFRAGVTWTGVPGRKLCISGPCSRCGNGLAGSHGRRLDDMSAFGLKQDTYWRFVACHGDDHDRHTSLPVTSGLGSWEMDSSSVGVLEKAFLASAKDGDHRSSLV